MTVARTVLVTGAGGQLGTELQKLRWPDGWEIVPVGREACDLRDPKAIAHLMATRPWDAVINCAAFTAVDKAEQDNVDAWAVNALAPAAFSQICAQLGIPILQLSTDYVFSGDRVGAWEVDDVALPLGVYGASKLGGELAVRTSRARHVILRTAWVFSAVGSNFVKTMLRVGAERDVVKVVDDQLGAPTSAADLARALKLILTRLIEDPAAPTGTFHFSNAGETTWAGFAAEIFRQAQARGARCGRVEPILTSAYPTPARRPANSLLSHSAIKAGYGITPRPWQSALSDTLDELIGAEK